MSFRKYDIKKSKIIFVSTLWTPPPLRPSIMFIQTYVKYVNTSSVNQDDKRKIVDFPSLKIVRIRLVESRGGPRRNYWWARVQKFTPI